MAIYAWRGRNSLGELIQGELDAVSEEAVADQLLSLGLVPVHIAPAPQVRSGETWWDQLKRRSIVIEDVLIFSRQMYTLNKARRPHTPGLRRTAVVYRQARHGRRAQGRARQPGPGA